MQQHLGRQDGVAKVDVNLLDGKVTILPKDDGQIDPAALLKATYDSGVTVVEMTMTARGRLMKDPSGSLVLQAGKVRSYPVAANDLLRSLEPLAGTSTEVTVRGRLYRQADRKQKLKSPAVSPFEILDIIKKD